AGRPAFDDIIQGGCGLVALEAATGGEARFVPTLIGDKTVGLTMVYAVMAALLQRERTGEGQAVEVPMLETMTAFVMAEHMGGLTFDPPSGEPGYSRMLAPDRRPHRAADGHVCILPYTDRHWKDFFRIAGRPDLADDPRLADAQTRSRDWASIRGRSCAKPGSPMTKSRICSPARSRSKRSNCDRIPKAIRGERDGSRSFQQRSPLQASGR